MNFNCNNAQISKSGNGWRQRTLLERGWIYSLTPVCGCAWLVLLGYCIMHCVCGLRVCVGVVINIDFRWFCVCVSLCEHCCASKNGRHSRCALFSNRIEWTRFIAFSPVPGRPISFFYIVLICLAKILSTLNWKPVSDPRQDVPFHTHVYVSMRNGTSIFPVTFCYCCRDPKIPSFRLLATRWDCFENNHL